MKTLWEALPQLGPAALVSVMMTLLFISSDVDGRAIQLDQEGRLLNYEISAKNITSDINYRLYLFLAQQEANCLRDYVTLTFGS